MYLKPVDTPAVVFGDFNFTDRSLDVAARNLMDLYLKRPLYPGGYDFTRKKYAPQKRDTWQFVDFLEANRITYGALLVDPIVAALQTFTERRKGGTPREAYDALVALANLLNHAMDAEVIRSSFLTPLNREEMADKTRFINLILDYLHPKGEAFRTIAAQEEIESLYPLDFKNYLGAIADIILSPRDDYRLMQAIKGTNSPYTSRFDDDDIEANRALITRLVNDKYGGGKFNSYSPNTAVGEVMAWDRWRRDDCVFAGILYAMTGSKKIGKGDAEGEQAAEQAIAAALGMATGIVEDPILVLAMRRLGWPYKTGLTWTTFKTRADQSKNYIISYDTVDSGNASHVVAAYYSDGWKVYDRQGIRLTGAGSTEPSRPNNPLNVWEVGDLETARSVIGDL